MEKPAMWENIPPRGPQLKNEDGGKPMNLSTLPCTDRPTILPVREQARLINQWLRIRLDTVLREVMTREGFDMWIVVTREYNDDPVVMSLLPGPILSGDFGLVLPPSRRRTILVFSLAGGVLRRMEIGGVGLTDLYESAWKQGEGQWEALARIVRECGPQRIGINVSEDFALADGLSHSQYEALTRAIGPEYTARLAGAERLAVGWLERRIPEEIEAYGGIVRIAHGIIEEAFSGRVVHPGVTTALDVAWWIRQRIRDLGLTAWFHPSVSVFRAGSGAVGPSEAIRPGDVLHCDVGLQYLGLCTDAQHLGYVLRLGEGDAPEGLRAAMGVGNRLQDIVSGEFQTDRTGNGILGRSLEKAHAEGIKARVYTHPIGVHGHGAGPTIGLWDQQDGVAGRGDYSLFEDTCYALELCVHQPIPEWSGQELGVYLEETVVFTGGRVHYLDGRQTAFHLIG